MKPKMISIPVVVGLACLLANLPCLSSRVNGQSNLNRAKSGDRPAASAIPRTSFGKPDLGGIWDFATITPLERPAQFAGKEFLRWEGDTLVIETRNFPSKPTFTDNRSSDMFRDGNLRVIERFSRLDVDTLNYEFTVNDPTMWSRPWTATFTLAKLPELMFEYACHEGNYAMTNILSGARIAAAESR